MWVTVLVSHPSVSIETETTQRTVSPRRPTRPTVFMTSRSRSSSVIGSAALPAALALHLFAAELFDLRTDSGAERGVEGFAGVHLFAVDQQRVWPGQAGAMFVVIAEQLQVAVGEAAALVAFRDIPLEAGDPFVDEFRGRGVVAHDDEYRWRRDAGARPFLECLFVVAVERVQRGLQLVRQGRAGRPCRSCRALSSASSCRYGPRGCDRSASRRSAGCPTPGCAGV